MKLHSIPQKRVLVGEPRSPYFARIAELGLPLRVDTVDGHDVERFADVLAAADSMLLWGCPPTARGRLFELAANVQWVHTHAAGVDSLPLQLIRERGIVLTNAAGVFAGALAEFAVAGILYFARDIPRLVRSQRAGRWEQFDVQEVAGTTALIVGFGGIGRAVAERLRAMRVRIIGCRNKAEPERLADVLVPPSDLARVVPEADFVIISAPLTADTRGLFGSSEIRAMKRSAVLVNIGRGPVVDEPALVAALEAGAIRGAALDVFDVEPLPPDHPFFRLENVLLSPHSADHTDRWLWDTLALFEEQLRAALAGRELKNVVDPHRGY